MCRTKLIIILSLAFITCFFAPLSGQIQESQRKDLEARARVMLDAFTLAIKKIGEKEVSVSTKDFLIEETLKNFKKDAIMEVSSYNSSGARRYSVKEYLTNLKNLKFDNVTITFVAEALYFDLNSFQKLPNEEKYVGSSAIVQCFCGTFESFEMSKFNYCGDCTKKVVEIVVEKVRDFNGERWRVLLGDVVVKETKKK